MRPTLSVSMKLHPVADRERRPPCLISSATSALLQARYIIAETRTWGSYQRVGTNQERRWDDRPQCSAAKVALSWAVIRPFDADRQLSSLLFVSGLKR
jgi:hypothetical protein